MTTLLEAAAAALRASADVHEAERIPHLVPALRALADALDTYEPAPPPGRCGAEFAPLRVWCNLRAGHAGQHEDALQSAWWSEPDPNEPYWNARAEHERRMLAAVHEVADEMAGSMNHPVQVFAERLQMILRRPMP